MEKHDFKVCIKNRMCYYFDDIIKYGAIYNRIKYLKMSKKWYHIKSDIFYL